MILAFPPRTWFVAVTSKSFTAPAPSPMLIVREAPVVFPVNPMNVTPSTDTSVRVLNHLWQFNFKKAKGKSFIMFRKPYGIFHNGYSQVFKTTANIVISKFFVIAPGVHSDIFFTNAPGISL
jgi:hypothetical protein